MKTVRTVTKVVVADEEIAAKPEFAVGDYMQVYFGQHEGHCFVIKQVRWNHDNRRFEYLYAGGLMGGWYPARQITLQRRGAR